MAMLWVASYYRLQVTRKLVLIALGYRGSLLPLKLNIFIYTEPSHSCSEEGALRLVDGGNEFEGRVEVCFRETWGTVCDDSWDSRDAEVVCRQLGHITAGALAFRCAIFGQGVGPVHLDDLACTGSEETLTSCRQSTPGATTCRHREDASVRCQAREGENGPLIKIL